MNMHLSEVIKEFPEELQRPIEHLVLVLKTQLGVSREDFTELKTTVQKLAEAQLRTEQRVDELAEAQKRTELRVEELAEAQKRTELRVEELAEAQRNTEITMNEGFKRLEALICNLGSRWGVQTESTLRNTLRSVLGKTEYTIKHGYYGEREVDVVIYGNNLHILLEITTSLKRGDIPKILASAADYEKQTGIAPRILIAAAHISPSAVSDIQRAGDSIELISADDQIM